jgi:hypothetical protein
MAMLEKKILVPVSESLIESALLRGRSQEDIYGHNTGHFTLNAEKENTIIGTLGELLLQKFLTDELNKHSNGTSVRLCDYGSQFDILIQHKSKEKYVHVKSGLWKKWPLNNWEFGIHADQNIQNLGAPLVLISFLKSSKDFPEFARIEGYLTSKFLQNAPLIAKGDKFPTTGVISRTNNILTNFSDYLPVTKMIESLISEKG